MDPSKTKFLDFQDLKFGPPLSYGSQKILDNADEISFSKLKYDSVCIYR